MKTFLTLGSVALAIALAGCPATPPTETTAPNTETEVSGQPADTSNNTQAAIEAAIVAYAQQEQLPLEDTRYYAAPIDLNGDGTQEVIVVLTGPFWCGTGGCTMLVLQRKEPGFALVSSSSLVRPPVTVSDTQTNGWRDLILEVSGGGMPPKTVALKFDGRQYPLNPSVQTAIADPSTVKGTVLFPEGTEPTTLTVAAQPSFDCDKAEGEVETLICQDNELAALDQKLAQVYEAALQKAQAMPPQDLSNFKAEQIGWIKGRNECWKAQDTGVRECVVTNYRDRIAALQATFALVPAQPPVFFACNNNPANEIVATFYETDPPTVRLERGDTTVLAYLRPAASGAKYEGRNVTFWTKGKEATVEWRGETLKCQAR